MGKIRIQKVSGAILAALILISIAIFCLFYFGGDTPEAERLVADTSMWEPAHTDALLFWLYALGAIAILVTLITVCYQFVSTLKHSPKDAMMSLLGIVLLVVLLGVTYTIGDGTPLNIVGYEGTENTETWLKITDMFCYSIYFMIALLCVLMIGFALRKRFI
jgi:amino acid transporter